MASTLCKGYATLNSILSGEVEDAFVVFLTGEEGEVFVTAFVASATFVVLHLSNADVPSCKGRELRETNPASPRLFTLGDFFPNLYPVITSGYMFVITLCLL